MDKTRWYDNKLGHHCDRGSSRTFTGFQSEHIYNIYYICKRSDSFQPLIEILLSSYGGARLHLEVGSLDVGTLKMRTELFKLVQDCILCPSEDWLLMLIVRD